MSVFPLGIHFNDIMSGIRRCGGLMVSAIDSTSSSPGASPSRKHCVLHFTLTVPLFTQVYKCTQVNLIVGWPWDGSASHAGEIEILLVTSCYRNQDKLWPNGPRGSYANFTMSEAPILIQKNK